MNFALANPTQTLTSVPSRLYSWMTDLPVSKHSRVHQTTTEITFTRNQIREVKTPLGVTLKCLSGRVWVTLDGDPRDVVLDQGQTFTVDRNQRTLVMALDEATVRCTASESA